MKLVREIFQRNQLLAWFGLFNFLLFLALIIVSQFDTRTLFSINVWVKPMKFFISIGLFSWTMAWLLDYIKSSGKVFRISLVIVISMLIEIIIINYQAYRGVPSHFNIQSVMDGVLFQIMGIAILVNTIMVFWSFVLFAKHSRLPKGYYWSIRMGMLIFIIASLEGFLMVGNLGHTIGADDGQEGYFFLNWAKEYGDLRVAHFLGLHALQVIPLFGWFVAKDKPKWVFIFSLLGWDCVSNPANAASRLFLRANHRNSLGPEK